MRIRNPDSKTEFPPAFLSASTLEAPNFSEAAAAVVPPPPARLFLPSEKVVEVEEVREGVGEGGLLLPAPPPPDRSELVLPTYIELFACSKSRRFKSELVQRHLT
jgi:hypothetical protein